MNATNETTTPVVLVTGAGTPAGIAVIRALAGRAEVVAVDVDPAAQGLQLAACGAIVPPHTSDAYAPAVAQVAVAMGARILVPTIPEELDTLRRGAAHLDAAGLAYLVPSAPAVERCVDLLRFADALRGAGLAHPVTTTDRPGAGDGPWILSPRVRTSDRTVLLVDDATEAAALADRLSDPVFQEVVAGRGFCADVLATTRGVAAGFARWRVAEPTDQPTDESAVGLLDACAAAVRALGLEGPVAVRGVVTEAGDVVVTDVEPRFSIDLVRIGDAGADLVGTWVDLLAQAHDVRGVTAT